MTKPGRNDPCPCGSGKKYKKCCELKETRSRFTATRLDSGSGMKKATGLTSLFQSTAASLPKKAQAETAEEKPRSDKPDVESKGDDLLSS